MTTLFIPSPILARVVACAPFADVDTFPSYSTLSGVSVSCTAGDLCIAATNGVALIEETFREANHASAWADVAWVVAHRSIPSLKSFLAQIGKKPTTVAVEATNPRGITLSCAGAAVTLATVDGAYPPYAPCLARQVEATAPGVFGINLQEIAKFSAAWGSKKGDGSSVRVEWNGLSFYVAPLNRTALGTRRGLIMPISLPT